MPCAQFYYGINIMLQIIYTIAFAVILPIATTNFKGCNLCYTVVEDWLEQKIAIQDRYYLAIVAERSAHKTLPVQTDMTPMFLFLPTTKTTQDKCFLTADLARCSTKHKLTDTQTDWHTTDIQQLISQDAPPSTNWLTHKLTDTPRTFNSWSRKMLHLAQTDWHTNWLTHHRHWHCVSPPHYVHTATLDTDSLLDDVMFYVVTWPRRTMVTESWVNT